MVPNIIEGQTIVVYVPLSSQGMSWKVHSEFADGHIKTHLYFPFESKDGFFFWSNFFVAIFECF
jgi:hypothetical protein